MARDYPQFYPWRTFPPAGGEQSDIPSQSLPKIYRPAAPRFSPAIGQDAAVKLASAEHRIRPAGGWDPPNDPRVPKITYVNRSTKIISANQPQKVLDQSLNRSSFEIGNNTGAVLLVNYSFPTLGGSGRPVVANSVLLLDGLACPDNEIWVTSSIVGGIITVYEGLPRFGTVRGRR